MFLNNLGVISPQVGKTQLSLTDQTFEPEMVFFPFLMLVQVVYVSSNVFFLFFPDYLTKLGHDSCKIDPHVQNRLIPKLVQTCPPVDLND